MSPISETYRTLRTNIQYSGVDGDIRTLMVTSATPWEGKSTTIDNLAVVYAQMDKKVLLIDADLRKPTAHRTFGITNRAGLTDVLTHQIEISEALKETEVPGLSVITSGTLPPNPSEILGSQRMAHLLLELKEKFDVILIDTPPVLAVSDAQVVASQCDGVLLVVSAGGVKRDLVQKARDNLQFVHARILGVVLNKVARKDAKMNTYYDYSS
ncbi:CpsD/CapB family tyrosine-protein kinase [Paenibacillus lutrae]|uniref:non-specific protein-tyrosine kinase n=1 Tax=Paenibacillus lutrae TaxID=2078573 RepID=A0A7X3FIP2_9BACL|nr:CpsD/CapB family tyrosine-protein kinase [Paenibacillus lutrae]MVP00494.1 polysaccharide biosynthesis tyrosine autokinase [Paenibacillus lutrae]